MVDTFVSASKPFISMAQPHVDAGVPKAGDVAIDLAVVEFVQHFVETYPLNSPAASLDGDFKPSIPRSLLGSELMSSSERDGQKTEPFINRYRCAWILLPGNLSEDGREVPLPHSKP